ncbi:ankyrin repeat protein, partial [Leptodontidium sp. 2 PMI_412]
MLEICQKELDSLLWELRKRDQGHRLSWERFKGAFLAKSTQESIQNLSRQCESLNSLLWIDVAVLGATIHKEVREGRKEQQEWHQADTKITLAIRDGAILDWLTPTDYSSEQSDFISRRQEGTGQWLLDCVEFQEWMHTDRQTLLCPGIPGVGKTILTAIVVNDLATRFTDNTTIGIAYIFCNFRRQGEQQPKDLLESLLRQLAEVQASLPESVMALYNKHKGRRTRPSLDEISTSLRSVVAVFSKVFIIVDAIDECQVLGGYRSKFLSKIFALQKETKVKLFATFRTNLDIEKNFKGHLSREILASDRDVQTYLDGHMSQLHECVSSSPKLQEEIKAVFSMTVGGMFLLAEFYLRELGQLQVPKAIRTALNQFKIEAQDSSDNRKFKVLLKVYDRAMDRIIGQGDDFGLLAKKVLSWITYATRPLTTLELRHAMAVEIGELELDEENLPKIGDLVSVCAGLVTVDKTSDIVRLVHKTAQEYFEHTQTRWFPDADADIATICVTYLSHSAFEGVGGPKDNDFEKPLQSNHLFEYAARNWGHHARTRPANSELNMLVLQFLESKSKVAGASHAMLTLGNHFFHRQKAAMGVKGLHLAAYFGLRNAAIELLKKGHDLEAIDADGRTPLIWAIDNGQEELVGVLLPKVLGIDKCDTSRRTALHHAASIGQITSMHLLIQHQADVEARDFQGQTPL